MSGAESKQSDVTRDAGLSLLWAETRFQVVFCSWSNLRNKGIWKCQAWQRGYCTKTMAFVHLIAVDKSGQRDRMNPIEDDRSSQHHHLIATIS